MTRTVRECSILNFRMGLVLAIMLWVLSCPLSLFAAVVNGDFSVAPGNEGFGWELEGDVTVAAGAAVLTEGAAYPTSIWQTFSVPVGVRYILFTLKTLDLKANAEGTEPDSFQVSLLKDSALGLPAVDPISTLSNTDALFSVQQTGELHYAQAVSVPGAAASGSAWSADNLPATVSVDLGTLTGEGAVTLYLYFDLLGADATGSTATIDDVVTIAPPVAVNDTAQTTEDTAVDVNVLANDTDADGALDPATVTVTVAPQHGQTAVDGQTGAITYTPALNYHGADSFHYTVKDTTGYVSNEAVVTVTVASVNDAPVAQDGSTATDEDVPFNGTLSASDVDEDTLTFSIVSPPSLGTVNLTNTSTGAFTYTPAMNAHGTDTFTFKVNDGTVDSNTATFTVTINPVNDAPVAQNGSAVTDEDVPFNGTLSASDVDGDTLTFSIVSPPSLGTVNLTNTSTGAFTYTPTLHAHGTDTFTFKVNDGTVDSNTATFTVTIDAVNDAPVAHAGDDQTVAEGTLVTLDGSGSSDVDGDTLFYRWEQVDGATVTLADATSAVATFTAPDVGPGGASLSFRLTVRDSAEGGLSATDTCIVNVTWSNLPPVANAGTDQTVNEGTLVTLDGSGSSDPDDGIKSYLWEQTDGPSVVLSDPAAATPTFTAPAVGMDGAELTFQLTVTDRGADYGEPGLRDTDTCTVTVLWINEAPTARAGVDQTVNEGALVTLDGSASTDPDDGIASYLWEVVTTAGLIAGQEVTLSDPTAVKPTFTAPQVGIGDGTVTLRLTVTDTPQGGALSDADEVTVTIRNVVPVGDVDDSGVVDLRDAIVMLRLIVRLPVNAGEFTARADADGDGVLALPEVLYVLRKVGEI